MSDLSATSSESGTPELVGRPLVLVIDDNAMCRDIVSKGLREEGLDVITAVNGEAGLVALEACVPHIIVLDNEMPRMNGLAFLRALRTLAKFVETPVIMLTGSRGKEVVVEAIRLKVAGYVLKDEQIVKALLHRVREVLAKHYGPDAGASGPVPNLVKRDAVIEALIQPSLVDLLAVDDAGDAAGDASAEVEIDEIVRQDPLLAAGVIHAAATAGSPTTDLAAALKTIGQPAARALARAVGLNAVCKRGRGDIIGMLRGWQHALATAVMIGRILPPSATAGGAAHLAALCHDLPEILLRYRFPKEFARLVGHATAASVAPAAMVEQAFGISYADLGSMLWAKLKFPIAAASALVEFHRHPLDAPPAAYDGEIPRALALANACAHGMLMCTSPEALVGPATVTECKAHGISVAAVGTTDIRVETVTTVSMLAELTGERDRALSAPLLGRRDRKMLYVRHPALAALDPMEAALRSLCSVEVSDKPVWAAQLATYDGVVVAAANPADPMFAVMDTMRSQLKTPIPVLKLFARSAAPETIPAGVQMANFPATLKSLANFVYGVGARAAA